MTGTDLEALDVREKIAQIDRALANHDRMQNKTELAPWILLITGLGTGAALFAAGAALMRLLG